VRIEWTCDPAQTDALVQRVFQEIAFVRNIAFQPGQVGRIRDALQHDYETNSLENGYLLGQIARRYENDEVADLAAVTNYPERLSELTGAAVHEAAMKYLDPANYVKVILMPEGR
jgi:predicted Zn-dependent peptidase